VTYSTVLALARAGAVDAAWSLLEASWPKQHDPAALALKGRLLKDRAAALGGAARISLLRQAAGAYAAAAEGRAATYPLINAATLSFLGADGARAEELARQTLALLDGGEYETDTPYWLGATRAEALLLLGREGDARTALARAIAAAPRAWEDHAVTIRQFRLILSEQGRSWDWLNAMRPPTALHFAGPVSLGDGESTVQAAIERAVDVLAPCSATGALAAGFDILAAESLLRSGAQLHIILPGSATNFVETSVRPFGEEWTGRFEAVLADATFETLDELYGVTTASVKLAEQMALGLAVQDALLRDAEPVMLRGRHERNTEGPGHFRTMEIMTGVARVTGASLSSPARLGALVGTPGSDLVPCSDLREAAELAMSLFEDKREAVTLDYGLSDDNGPIALERLETLQAISISDYPIASRQAALCLSAVDAPFRTVVAGEASSTAATFEYSSLWRRNALLDHQIGQQTR